MSSKKFDFIFVGGGSGGHTITALNIIKSIPTNYKIHFIGSINGIERNIISNENISYSEIRTGKLRRYFSFQNFLDLINILIGIIQSFFKLITHTHKKTKIVSTGGFVSVPVVVSAFLLRRKIFIHEQTTKVGLANKIASKLATKVFISFEESKRYFPQNKTITTGYPLRQELIHFKNLNKDYLLINDEEVKIDAPILFVTGGGNGSLLLNNHILSLKNELEKNYIIIHQVGKNHLNKHLSLKNNRYFPFSFIQAGMIDLLVKSKVIISRSGAGTVLELIALKKPSIFIPLAIAQKNEQYTNALAAKKALHSIIIEEKDLNKEVLIQSIKKIAEFNYEVNTNISNEACQKILKEIIS